MHALKGSHRNNKTDLLWLASTCPWRNFSQVVFTVCRDLKPANIMVQGKTYKLGDFGFSKQLNYVYMP